MPIGNAQKPVTWRFYKAHVETLQVSRYNIHEIGRIEKYGRDVGLQLRFKLRVQLCARGVVVGGAQLLQNVVGGRVGVERDVKPRVGALARVPKRKEVELAADDLAKKECVVFARTDDVLRKVALVVNLHINLCAHFLPLGLHILRRGAELGYVVGCEAKLEHDSLRVFAGAGCFLEHAAGAHYPASFDKLRARGERRVGLR